MLVNYLCVNKRLLETLKYVGRILMRAKFASFEANLRKHKIYEIASLDDIFQHN